ncbi:RBBP9/YdeN family alpha/beta hydrolase [Actinomadura parmotrematis]|uniref:Alpha/beta hydrolase n=1 Tax=Actinomadura parmotrematis TaxID=2864039 RepID=A0ABS7FUE0_9ACTN|nr:alpha/beta hydrolase [Actinomadura parmotrematis]MBW8484025.1 alpha/beta hydrolase [Actinomadura parmotrematis]
MSIVIVPGWQGSGPGHWQSRWAEAVPGAVRVEQDDWDVAERDAWVARLGETIAARAAPPVLVAHSLGVLTVVEWAARTGGAGARGALLVAPPDMDRLDIPDIRNFAPIPDGPLPFPAILVGSRDDAYMSLDRARHFADAWGARFHDAGAAGHLNIDAGFGPWPEGERLLAELEKTLNRR